VFSVACSCSLLRNAIFAMLRESSNAWDNFATGAL
jgi:hypothetical protein